MRRATDAAPGPAGTAAVPSRGRLARGIALNLLLAGMGMAAVFMVTDGVDLPRVWTGMNPLFLWLALGAAVLDILIGAVRYQIFLRHIRPGTPLSLPVRADLANRFVGAVTPSQTGGGPAQIYILHRGGIPVGDALAFLTINFLATMVFFLSAAGATAWILQDHVGHRGVEILVRYGFLVLAAAAGLLVVVLARPGVVVRPLERISASLGRFRSGWSAAARRGVDALLQCSEQYGGTCTRFVRGHPLLLAGSLGLTGVLYLNKFTLAWFIMRGLGVDVAYGPALAVQTLLHFVLYVAPTPGGSGVAEVSTGALMALLLPAHLLGPFTVLLRVLLVYLPASVGAVVLLRAVRPVGMPRVVGVGSPAVLACVAAAAGLAAAPVAVAGATTGDTVPTLSVAPVRTLSLAPVSPILDGAYVTRLLVSAMEAPDPATARLRTAEASLHARVLVEGDPSSAEARFLLASALGLELEHLGIRARVGAALEVKARAEEALGLDPDHAGAHHVLGRVHAGAMRMGTVERFVATRILGGGEFRQASWEEAERHFSRARELEPDNPRHLMELGALYLDTGREGLAAEVLARAVATPPSSPADSLAVVRAALLLGSR